MKGLQHERPRARDDVVFRALDDEWVLYDPRADRLHVLNLTAALVWAYCGGEQDVSGIADAVGSAFTPPRSGAEVTDDVAAALARFEDEGLFA